MKFLTKKAWYNFYTPFGYKMFYFCAFVCFFIPIFEFLLRIGMPFPQLSGGGLSMIFLWFLAICFVAGIIPALSIIYALDKALK